MEPSQVIPEDALPTDLVRLRLVMLVGGALIALFMIADLRLLPKSLHDVYLSSRLFMQLPVVLALLVFSFHRHFARYYQLALTLALLALTYANYFLIYQCWQQARFSFPYEGTVLYAFFGFFVMGMSFRRSLFHLILTSTGFIALVLLFPVYGDRSTVNLGFVIGSQFIGVIGRFRLDALFGKIQVANEQLRQMSTTDALTNLLNRRALIEEGDQLLSLGRRSAKNVAAFMVDIDHFKGFNDAYGHQEGDRAIRIQADILTAVFQRQTDILGRYGGEEFLAVAMDVSEKDCDRLAAKILKQWEDRQLPNARGAGREFLSCSIGICHGAPSRFRSLEEMIRGADEALYQAKNQGRGCFVRSSVKVAAATEVRC